MVRQCGLAPFNDQVIVKVLEKEEKTPGGIVLPDNAKARSPKAIVVGVGPGWKSNDGASRLALDVKLNDIVYYRENQGEYVINDGVEDYVVVSAANILCKVK
jgi:chaperonin GroES